MRLLILLVLVHQIFARSQPAHLTEQNFHRCLNPFSFDVLKKFEFGTSNVFFSPLSIGMTIGMLLEGAKNEDRVKLFQLLHCDNFGNRDTIHRFFNKLLVEYKDMAIRDTNPRNVTVELANLMMLREGITLPDTFIDPLKKDYEAAVQNENFASNGQQVVDKINKYVDERTHGLIPKLFKEPLSPTTIMVLINTIYFKGYWDQFFNKDFTREETFFNVDKTEKKIQMMQRIDTYLNYFHSQKHKASFVEIPYLGEMSMFIIVPDEKYGLPNVVQSLNGNDFTDVLPRMNNTNVDIYLPKFEFDFTANLMKVFDDLGVNIRNALKPVHSSLDISGAIHTAKIRTHETGTEAAAVTVLIAVDSSSLVKPEPKVIKADHPFMFVILDKKSKVNMFTGTVNRF